MNMTTSFSVKAAYQTEPGVQIQRLRARAQREGREFDESRIPTVPSFTPQSGSEVLLLMEHLEGDAELSSTARTFLHHWEAIDGDKRLDVQVATIADGYGVEHEPGFAWVVFDPLGARIDNDTDFRADIYVGMEDRSATGVRRLYGGTADPGTAAGLEVFAALAAFPDYIQEAWQVGENPLHPIMARLEGAASKRWFPEWAPGALQVMWWKPEDGISCWVQGWGHNFYGFEWVIPKIRPLPR